MAGTSSTLTDRSRVRRAHKRGSYDLETIYQVLDAGLVAHIGFSVGASNFVIPTFYWRHGNFVYWHGSSASQMLRQSEDQDICFTVTHLDGLILASSAFHHSANYRSAMIFGQPELVVDSDQKENALKQFVDHLFPGRWDTLRPMTDQEFRATSVLRLEISDASAKIRTGPPTDDKADEPLLIWGGELSFVQHFGEAYPDPVKPVDLPVPDHVTRLVGKSIEQTLVKKRSPN